MATVSLPFDARDLIPALTNGPNLAVVEGTNFPVPQMVYDAATEWTAYLRFTPINYGSGNVTVTVTWYAAATTGNAILGAALAAVTPGTESVQAAAFDTAATTTTTVAGTTLYTNTTVITITAVDSIAAGDDVWLKLYRDADAVGDDMAGNLLLIGGVITYSDT